MCLDERYRCVRRRRVVPTPRCWRQVARGFLGADGGKRAVLRGEHVISRKAIAQGMSDCLRCPVCSYAQPLLHCVRDRGCSAHPAFPAPSVLKRSRKLLVKLGRNVSRDCETVSAVIARSTCDEAIHSFFPRRDGLLRRVAPRNDD